MLEELRKKVSDYGKRMFNEGLTRGTGGYISARDKETGLICSTPSAIPYLEIEPEDVLVSDVDGNIIEGNGKISSEWFVMSEVYKNRPDINALVHAHAKFSTVLSALRQDLPASCFSLPIAGGPNVRCTAFHSFYSQDLADDIFDKMRDRKAVLMGNHGLLAGGDDLDEAYSVANTVEYCAEIHWMALCAGTPVPLTEEETEIQIADTKRYSKKPGF